MSPARRPSAGRRGSATRVFTCRIPSPRGPIAVTWTAQVTRRENVGISEPIGDAERAMDLEAEPLVPLSGPVRELSDRSTAGLANDAAKARAIYDKVTAMMRYDKSGTGWGRGDALFACDARRGNCTDFHALVIGMARSAGIPARFAIGLSLPEARGSGDLVGYHCWAELYVRGRGWVPVDASEAVKHPARRDYFFGHHDENRLELSRGRNLTLRPAQHGPALNFFVDPYAEVNGRPHAAVDRRVMFRDREPAAAPRAEGRRPSPAGSHRPDGPCTRIRSSPATRRRASSAWRCNRTGSRSGRSSRSRSRASARWPPSRSSTPATASSAST